MTAPTGEPIIDSMMLTAVDFDNSAKVIPGDKPAFRPSEEAISAYQLWQIHRKRRDLREGYMDHWNATISQAGTGRPVDAIISPCAPYTAPPHGHNRYECSRLISYFRQSSDE